MINQYQTISDYYDLWTTSGYYDYRAVAEEAHAVVGDVDRVLELGVGTGLFAEQYVQVDGGCHFTGVDFSASMLEIAKRRASDRVELIEADAVTMDLGGQFDVAISNGGVWLFVKKKGTWQMSSHIPGLPANRRGMENAQRHLRSGGRFLLSRQASKGAFGLELPDGIQYSQTFADDDEPADVRSLVKTLRFERGGVQLAEERLHITMFREAAIDRLFDEAGFDEEGISEGGGFTIYRKR